MHEKSTRACPMMSMLPTTLFFEFTSWRHFLSAGKFYLQEKIPFTTNTKSDLGNALKPSGEPTNSSPKTSTRSPSSKKAPPNRAPWTLPRESGQPPESPNDLTILVPADDQPGLVLIMIFLPENPLLAPKISRFALIARVTSLPLSVCEVTPQTPSVR